MYLTELFLSLRRRWYLVLVVLVLAVATTTAIVSRLPATYRTNASIVLVPPDTTLGDTGNPYLFLGGLEQSVDVLSRDLGSEQVRSQMARQADPSASYTVMADYTTSAPIVLVTAEAHSAAAADAMLGAVVEQVPVSLARLQESLNVRGSAQITTQLIARSEEPEPVMSDRYRAMVMIGGALVVLGLLLVAMVDGLLRRRRLRAAGAVEAAPDEVAQPASLEHQRRKTGTDG